jgi:hypothetical protein
LLNGIPSRHPETGGCMDKKKKVPKKVETNPDIKIEQENDIPEVKQDHRLADKVLYNNYEVFLWNRCHW